MFVRAGLDPRLAPAAGALYEWAWQSGLNPRITSVRRSYQQQAVLYDRFRRGMSDLPAAPPGHSKHERGLAWDMVTSSPAIAGAAWRSVGGRWFASDYVHFEV